MRRSEDDAVDGKEAVDVCAGRAGELSVWADDGSRQATTLPSVTPCHMESRIIPTWQLIAKDQHHRCGGKPLDPHGSLSCHHLLLTTLSQNGRYPSSTSGLRTSHIPVQSSSWTIFVQTRPYGTLSSPSVNGSTRPLPSRQSKLHAAFNECVERLLTTAPFSLSPMPSYRELNQSPRGHAGVPMIPFERFPAAARAAPSQR